MKIPISEISDPWDALDALEEYAACLEFIPTWRLFLRDCSLLLMPGLPAVAADWVATADKFDLGQLDATQLTAARVEAWKFHDVCRDMSPASELSALRAVMYRLWPPDPPERWHEAVGYFLDFCEEAGLHQERWEPLFRERFKTFLGGQK